MVKLTNFFWEAHTNQKKMDWIFTVKYVDKLDELNNISLVSIENWYQNGSLVFLLVLFEKIYSSSVWRDEEKQYFAVVNEFTQDFTELNASK